MPTSRGDVTRGAQQRCFPAWRHAMANQRFKARGRESPAGSDASTTTRLASPSGAQWTAVAVIRHPDLAWCGVAAAAVGPSHLPTCSASSAAEGILMNSRRAQSNAGEVLQRRARDRPSVRPPVGHSVGFRQVAEGRNYFHIPGRLVIDMSSRPSSSLDLKSETIPGLRPKNSFASFPGGARAAMPTDGQ